MLSGIFADSARYCLVRLLLRTSNRWYAISNLGSYKNEVGDDGLATAMKALCSLFTEPMARESKTRIEPTVTVKLEPSATDIFDELWPQRAGTSQLPQPVDPIHSLLSSDISSITMKSFCQNESIMTTREILDRINRDELVTLAKEMRCKLRANSKVRESLVNPPNIHMLYRRRMISSMLSNGRPQANKFLTLARL